MQILRSLVEQKLTVAVEEIFGLFERAIAEHEEEFCRIKEENQRLRQMVDEVCYPSKHKTESHSDIQIVKIVKEEKPEWSPGLVQEGPQVPHVKEEQNEVLIIQEEHEVPERTDFTQITTGVKAEDGGAATQVSKFHQGQTVVNTMETPQEDYGGSDPDPDLPSDADNTDNSSDPEESNSNQKENRRHRSYLHPKMAPPTARLYERMEIEANGEDCGSPEPGSSLNPQNQTDSDDKTENSSDTDEDQKKGTCQSKRHQCSECNKVFSKGQPLKRHKKTSVRQVHRPGSQVDVHKSPHTEKWHSCPVCQKSFQHKFALVRHMKVHTQERLSTGQRHNQESK